MEIRNDAGINVTQSMKVSIQATLYSFEVNETDDYKRPP
jgi:hypothetical protein